MNLCFWIVGIGKERQRQHSFASSRTLRQHENNELDTRTDSFSFLFGRSSSLRDHYICCVTINNGSFQLKHVMYYTRYLKCILCLCHENIFVQMFGFSHFIFCVTVAAAVVAVYFNLNRKKKHVCFIVCRFIVDYTLHMECAMCFGSRKVITHHRFLRCAIVPSVWVCTSCRCRAASAKRWL